MSALSIFNSLIHKLSLQGISFPLNDFQHKISFDEYVKERLFIFTGHLFSRSDHLRKRSFLRFLKSGYVNMSLITINDPEYQKLIKDSKKHLLVSEDYDIINEYNKKMNTDINFKWNQSSLNKEYKTDNNYILFIYETWVQRNHQGNHLQFVYVNNKNKSLYLFDPSSYTRQYKEITNYLLDTYYKGYKFQLIENKPMDFQTLNSRLFYTLDFYCVIWSFMMSYLFLSNPKIAPKKIVDTIWSLGDKSRFLMVYFSYMLYEENLENYNLNEHQYNQLSLHKKLNNDINKLEKINNKAAHKLKDFLKFYDLFMYYLEDEDSIKYSNDYLYDEIKYVLEDIEKGKTKDYKEKFIDFVYSINNYDLPLEISQKIVAEQINNECVLF